MDYIQPVVRPVVAQELIALGFKLGRYGLREVKLSRMYYLSHREHMTLFGFPVGQERDSVKEYDSREVSVQDAMAYAILPLEARHEFMKTLPKFKW